MKTNAGSEKSEGAGSAGENDDEEQVSYATYKKLLDQRKADRERARELQAKLDAAEAERGDAEKARLAEQQRFKELYEAEKKRAEELNGKLSSMTQAQIEARKREALKAELGGVRKDDYLKFADMSAIQVNEDGTVDTDAVKAAAAKFREAYPELVTAKSNSRPLPNEAAAGYQPPKPKTPAEMTQAELREHLKTALKG